MPQKSSATAPTTGFSLQNVVLQLILTALVFYAWSSPAIQPVKLMVVLFHEMSHGLVALLTGGKVVAIQITSNEGGACETEGGSALLIVSAGYLGSMFFGGLILYLSRARHFVPMVFGLLTIILVAAIATVLRDSYSRTFASCLAGAFIVLGFVFPPVIGGFCLRALGTFACLYSLFDIYWDILAARDNAHHINDAIAFSQLTGISPQMVGMSWLVASVIFFLVVLRGALLPDIEPTGVKGSPAPALA